MKHVMIEDGIYKLSDKKYEKLYKMGKEYLESLEYDQVEELIISLGGKYIGDIFMNFRF